MSARLYETQTIYETPGSHSFQICPGTGTFQWKSEASVGNVKGVFGQKMARNCPPSDRKDCVPLLPFLKLLSSVREGEGFGCFFFKHS